MLTANFRLYPGGVTLPVFIAIHAHFIAMQGESDVLCRHVFEY